MAVTAIALITGTTVAGYLVVRADHSDVGAAFAAASLPGSRAMTVLEDARAQMISMNVASHSMRRVGGPKLASTASATASTSTSTGRTGGTGSTGSTGSTGGGAPVNAAPPNPGTAQSIAYNMLPSFGFSQSQFSCLNNIWSRESGWRWNAYNPSGAYGIPQALPGSKMASAGADWQTNPATQIRWGLGYIKGQYGTPCNAWAFWEGHGYY